MNTDNKKNVALWFLSASIGVHRRLNIALLVLLLLSLPVNAELHITTIPDGVRIGWLGDKPAAPAPTVFFLGGGIEDSFNAPHYQEAVDALGSAVLKVALDLPGFGAQKRPDEPPSLPGWRYRLDHNEDVAADFTVQAVKALNYLVESKLTDPNKVAAFGTSRGGFMSLQFAAADPRVRSIAGFAPVTDLLMLSEFAGMQNDQPARALSTLRLADRLADRAIWIGIGSTDNRVGTHRAIEFAERIIEAATARGMQPKIELHVRPTNGHTTPAGSYGAAARWLLDQWR